MLENWNFFKIVTLAWGMAALLTKPVFFGLLGNKWKNWLLGKAYRPGERPAWILPVALLSVGLIAYTWYRVAVDSVAYDWILAVLMSVSAIKLVALLFQYDQFQAWVTTVLTDQQKQTMMVLQVTAVGLVFVFLAFWLYG